MQSVFFKGFLRRPEKNSLVSQIIMEMGFIMPLFYWNYVMIIMPYTDNIILYRRVESKLQLCVRLVMWDMKETRKGFVYVK